MLEKLRKEIDLVDTQLTELLQKRLSLVLQTKVFKPMPEDSGREQKILARLKEKTAQFPFPQYYEQIYKTIFKEGRKLQENSYVLCGFTGKYGNDCHVAITHFDESIVGIQFASDKDLFQSLDGGAISFAAIMKTALPKTGDFVVAAEFATDAAVIGKNSNETVLIIKSTKEQSVF